MNQSNRLKELYGISQGVRDAVTKAIKEVPAEGAAVVALVFLPTVNEAGEKRMDVSVICKPSTLSTVEVGALLGHAKKTLETQVPNFVETPTPNKPENLS